LRPATEATGGAWLWLRPRGLSVKCVPVPTSIEGRMAGAMLPWPVRYPPPTCRQGTSLHAKPTSPSNHPGRTNPGASPLLTGGPLAVPDTRKFILITRPEPGASDTAARVALLGLVPILTPVIRIERPPARLPPAASLAAVLVTSGNAVAALPAAYRGTRVFSVGDATADRARAAGFAQVFSAAGDAEALAEFVIRHQSPRDGTLLLAAGHGQGQALAAALRQAGYRVARRAVYAARAICDLTAEAVAALRTDDVRAALFFSAETARQFVRLAQRAGLADSLNGVEAISIGQPAAVALDALQWRGVRVAARPTQDDMLALLR
jgi:uroporphyrinogen-III synthase